MAAVAIVAGIVAVGGGGIFQNADNFMLGQDVAVVEGKQQRFADGQRGGDKDKGSESSGRGRGGDSADRNESRPENSGRSDNSGHPGSSISKIS